MDRARIITAAALLWTLAACSGGPVLRGSAPPAGPAPADGSDPIASQCAQLRSDIRAYQEDRREAPSTSTSPQIVDAAEGKADHHIDDLRQQLDDLDCPSDSDASSKTRPLAPLPPAPGGNSAP